MKGPIVKRIDFSDSFDKQLKKAPPKIVRAFRNRLDIFTQNPSHLLLRNHTLKGEYAGHRSINVTGDWRAMYIEKDEAGELVIVFMALGTHSQLYKK